MGIIEDGHRQRREREIRRLGKKDARREKWQKRRTKLAHSTKGFVREILVAFLFGWIRKRMVVIAGIALAVIAVIGGLVWLGMKYLPGMHLPAISTPTWAVIAISVALIAFTAAVMYKQVRGLGQAAATSPTPAAAVAIQVQPSTTTPQSATASALPNPIAKVRRKYGLGPGWWMICVLAAAVLVLPASHFLHGVTWPSWQKAGWFLFYLIVAVVIIILVIKAVRAQRWKLLWYPAAILVVAIFLPGIVISSKVEDRRTNASATAAKAAEKPKPFDLTLTMSVSDDWTKSEAYAFPIEAAGAQVTWTLLDAKGETDCFHVRLSQGEFPVCPGQKFADIPGTTNFVRFKMDEPQEAPREIVVRIKKT